jgi:hypothetical protein
MILKIKEVNLDYLISIFPHFSSSIYQYLFVIICIIFPLYQFRYVLHVFLLVQFLF